jgi:sortase (surface protein transpeptidase)
MTRGRGRLAIGAAALALLLAGCASASAGRQGSEPGGASAPGSTRSGAEAAQNFRSERSYQGTPEPVRIDIPRIGVTSRLLRLGRDEKGAVETPPESAWDVAGWYTGGPRPGDPGSAVILGHVDSKKSGPAVFYRLRELRPGDQVRVTRADGSVVRFGVQRTAQFPKASFPTDQVYYPTLAPELRLVTCGGSFDDIAGHYRSNIIVFAQLQS